MHRFFAQRLDEQLAELSPEEAQRRRTITKSDFFRDGLTGRPDSAQRRDALKRRLALPQRLTTNGLLDVLNQLYDYPTYLEIIETIKEP